VIFLSKRKGLFSLLNKIRGRKQVKVKPISISKIKQSVQTPGQRIIKSSKELGEYLERKKRMKSIYD